MSKSEIVDQLKDPQVFELREYLVMLAADVAQIFNVETRIIVQNIKRNNVGSRPLFPNAMLFKSISQNWII